MAVVVAAARDEAEAAGLLEAAQRACGAEVHDGSVTATWLGFSESFALLSSFKKLCVPSAKKVS